MIKKKKALRKAGDSFIQLVSKSSKEPWQMTIQEYMRSMTDFINQDGDPELAMWEWVRSVTDALKEGKYIPEGVLTSSKEVYWKGKVPYKREASKKVTSGKSEEMIHWMQTLIQSGWGEEDILIEGRNKWNDPGFDILVRDAFHKNSTKDEDKVYRGRKPEESIRKLQTEQARENIKEQQVPKEFLDLGKGKREIFEEEDSGDIGARVGRRNKAEGKDLEGECQHNSLGVTTKEVNAIDVNRETGKIKSDGRNIFIFGVECNDCERQFTIDDPEWEIAKEALLDSQLQISIRRVAGKAQETLQGAYEEIQNCIDNPGEFSHNIASLVLRQVAKLFGVAEANKIIDHFDLTEVFGIHKVARGVKADCDISDRSIVNNEMDAVVELLQFLRQENYTVDMSDDNAEAIKQHILKSADKISRSNRLKARRDQGGLVSAGNMGYCRFENTLGDLKDCQEALDNGEAKDEDMSSPEEKRSRDRLIELCGVIYESHAETDFSGANDTSEDDENEGEEEINSSGRRGSKGSIPKSVLAALRYIKVPNRFDVKGVTAALREKKNCYLCGQAANWILKHPEEYIGMMVSSAEEDDSKTLIAKWSASGGKRFVELFKDDRGYTYSSGLGGGGVLPKLGGDEEAIKWAEENCVKVLKSDFPSVKRVK